MEPQLLARAEGSKVRKGIDGTGIGSAGVRHYRPWPAAGRPIAGHGIAQRSLFQSLVLVHRNGPQLTGAQTHYLDGPINRAVAVFGAVEDSAESVPFRQALSS